MFFVLVVDPDYISTTCLWRGGQVEVKGQSTGADYLCVNPSPTSPVWDAVPQFPSLSTEDNNSTHVIGLLGESMRKYTEHA